MPSSSQSCCESHSPQAANIEPAPCVWGGGTTVNKQCVCHCDKLVFVWRVPEKCSLCVRLRVHEFRTPEETQEATDCHTSVALRTSYTWHTTTALLGLTTSHTLFVSRSVVTNSVVTSITV